MVLLIASALDPLAQEVAAAWPGTSAALLTPRDLCTRGWHIEPGDFASGTIVAGGAVVTVRAISGALVLLPYVPDYELFTIVDEDRKYAASELNAFLLYFLSQLPCRLLNRPTPYGLTGPNWRTERWLWACQQVGLPTLPAARGAASPAEGTQATASVSIVGNKCLGDAAGLRYTAAMRDLARLAGVGFLSLRFARCEGEQFVQSVSLTPDLQDQPLLTAIQHYLAN